MLPKSFSLYWYETAWFSSRTVSLCSADSSNLPEWKTVVSIVCLGGDWCSPFVAIIAAAPQQQHWCHGRIHRSKASATLSFSSSGGVSHRQQQRCHQLQSDSQEEQQEVFFVESSCWVYQRAHCISGNDNRYLIAPRIGVMNSNKKSRLSQTCVSSDEPSGA